MRLQGYEGLSLSCRGLLALSSGTVDPRSILVLSLFGEQVNLPLISFLPHLSGGNDKETLINTHIPDILIQEH